MSAHAAIRYHADSFDTRVGQMMGRQRAGEGFLRGWVEHAGADPVTGWVQGTDQAAAFAAHVREFDPAARLATAGVHDTAPLRAAGALMIGDPALDRFAWERRWVGQAEWSLIGITHTMSSASACARLAALLTAPLQPWDALICTSTAIARMARTVLDEQADYLRERLSATRLDGPELPVIPLGVHAADHRPDPTDRARWRAELGLADGDVAVLQFGRISIHAKSHPLPLYRALEAAAAQTGRPLHLVLAGRFINPETEALHRALARAFAETVPTHFVDGARADAESVRAAADIATLLADSIQETFGLAPVELMAAGLPVVASDWDGLRDTVEHGTTGFLIPTIMPPPGAGRMLTARWALGIDEDDTLLGAVGQTVAVDISAAAEAFATLAADPARRTAMGAAGRRRIDQLFDWPVVIGRYRDLLAELADRRRAGAGERARPRPGAVGNLACPDPFTAFAAHASRALSGDALLRAVPGAPTTIDAAPGGRRLLVVAAQALPDVALLDRLIARLRAGEATSAKLADEFGGAATPAQIAAAATWLVKFGFARLA